MQRAPNDIQWKIDKCEFDEMMATKKESALGPDVTPKSKYIYIYTYVCAGGLGSQLLFNAYKRVLEEGAVSAHFVARRTVFIPKSSTVDDNGLIVRSPDA